MMAIWGLGVVANAPKRLRQEDYYKFRAGLGYVINCSRPSRAI